MDEPVGHTIDGTPWEEARGPHLPDRLTRIPGKLPRASWAFVILAVATGLLLALDHGLPTSPDIDTALYIRTVLGLILWLIPPIATVLFGAALFARHRRAWATHRLLAVGLVMLAAGEAMQAASDPVAGLFWLVTPSDDQVFLTPGLVAYTLMTLIVLGLGFINVARGLRAARHRPDREGGSKRAILIVAAILLAGSSVVVGIVEISRAVANDPDDVNFTYNVTVLALGWLIIAAQAYLAVTLWAGMAAGERPAGAWRLGTAGVWLILIASGSASVSTAALLATSTPEVDFTLWSWISLVWMTVSVAGYVLLLAGFSRGLPSEPEDDRPAWAG